MSHGPVLSSVIISSPSVRGVQSYDWREICFLSPPSSGFGGIYQLKGDNMSVAPNLLFEIDGLSFQCSS